MRRFFIACLASVAVAATGQQPQQQTPRKTLPKPRVGIDAGGSQATRAESKWRVREFVADGSGLIWGLAILQNSSAPVSDAQQTGSLATFDAATSQWRSEPCPEAPAESHAEHLAVLADGRVVCLWRNGTESILTTHYAGKGKRWCSLAAAFNEPRLLPLSDGGLAITERGPHMARIPADDAPPVLTSIPEAVLTKPVIDPESSAYAAVHAVECSDGSIVLWNYSLQRLPNLWHIEGLASWTGEPAKTVPGVRFKPGSPMASWSGGGTIKLVSRLPLNPGPVISAVIADGKDGLFVAEAGVGLWRLHWPDAQGTKIAAPGQTFAFIEKLTFVKGALHIITCPKPLTTRLRLDEVQHLIKMTADRNLVKRTGMLWRMDGKSLVPLATGLDMVPRYGWEERPVVATAKGLLVGAVGSGPWWLPFSSAGHRYVLDGTERFPLGDGADVLSTAGNKFLTRSSQGQWSHLPLPGDEPAAVGPRLSVLRTRQFLLQDSRLHIWALRADEKDLAEWDGKAWHRHELPAELVDFTTSDFAADGHDQGWLIHLGDGPLAVLDFKTARWRIFESPEQAVTEMLAPGDQVVMLQNIFCGPVSHRNGDMGFLGRDGIVHVRIRGKWTRANIMDFAGPFTNVSGVPFFDEDGRFTVPIASKHYQMDADGSWAARKDAATSKDRTRKASPLQPPAGCTVKHISSTVFDRHGVAWITTWDNELWKWLDGVEVRLNDNGRPLHLPIPTGEIGAVFTDARHNAFLQRSRRDDEVQYDMVRARTPPTVTPAKILSIEASAARVRLPSGPGVWNRWRLDDTPSGRLTQTPEMKLDGLLAGKHQITIECFDEELTPIGNPQALVFTITVASKDVLAAHIERLRTGDLPARETAARALKAQGLSALPALKQSLRDANNNATLHWWLNAIIQHIETEQAKPK